MNYPVLSVRDNLVGFGAPEVAINLKVAERRFVEGCKNSNHAEDMELWEIGTFDDETGHIIPLEPIMLVVKGASIKKD